MPGELVLSINNFYNLKVFLYVKQQNLKNKNIKFARLAYILIQIVYIQIIFTHLKLLVAIMRHNHLKVLGRYSEAHCKWLKIVILYFNAR